MDAGLLIVRWLLGLGMAAHGCQKLFGWFGGGGIQGFSVFFEKLGFRPAPLFVVAAGLGEIGSGLLVVLGVLGGVGPALMVMVMLVAMFSTHFKNGFFISKQGWELNGVYIAGALALAFGGFGAYSIDALVGLHLLTEARQVWLLMAAAVVLAALNLLARRPAPVPPAPQA